MAVRDRGRVEAAAVVDDPQPDPLRDPVELQPHLARARVLDDVVERLLGDPVERLLDVERRPLPRARASTTTGSPIRP